MNKLKVIVFSTAVLALSLSGLASASSKAKEVTVYNNTSCTIAGPGQINKHVKPIALWVGASVFGAVKIPASTSQLVKLGNQNYIDICAAQYGMYGGCTSTSIGTMSTGYAVRVTYNYEGMECTSKNPCYILKSKNPC